MKKGFYILLAVTLLAWKSAPAWAQNAPAPMEPAPQFNESGQVAVNGHSAPFLIRRLPVNSFPQLPSQIAAELTQRGCMIPQTYEAHRPENVIHASLQDAGSSDWAVLCSAHGRVSLLVFFGSDLAKPMELVSAAETTRLQTHGANGMLGFNWGIDQASPEQVQEALSGMSDRPATLDHDALEDSVIEHHAVYHYFAKGVWTLLQAPQE